MRISGRNLAESSPQFGNAADVALERLTPGATDGVLEDRIHLDRLRHAAHGFLPGAHLEFPAEDAVGCPGRAPPAEFDASAARLCLGAAALGAGQDDDVASAVLNLERTLGQHRLHGVAAPQGHSGLGLEATQGFGNRPRRILIRPHPPDDPYGVRRGRERRRAGIDRGFADGVDHQFQGFLADGLGGVGVALLELRNADEHGFTGAHRASIAFRGG